MKSLALVASIILLCACGRDTAQSSALAQPSGPTLPSVAVKVQAAKLEPHAAVEEVVGTVRSQFRAVVAAKVSGRVTQYRATPGTKVKAGDLLAVLDAQEIASKVDQARAVLEQAQGELDRQTHLLARDATTRQEYDATNARAKVAKASLNEAQTMLGYSRVTAPFDGVVTRKLADVGDLAMPGKPLLEIEAPTAFRFEADVPEAILDRVQLGAKMNVAIASINVPLEATVSEIAPVADAVSRTFQVKLDLPSAEGLRTGQFGRVGVPVAETQLLLVPADAVLRRGQLELVFVAKEGKAALRLIKTGKVLEQQVEILSGLEQGEQVIVHEVHGLVDGQPVTIQP
jgi:RND family efflux transporter MFP subunit